MNAEQPPNPPHQGDHPAPRPPHWQPGPPPGGAGPYAPPPPPPPAVVCPYPPHRPSAAGRFFRGLLVAVFILSIMLNIYLLALLGTQFAGGFDKTVVRHGQQDQQIALYDVVGTIDDAAARQFSRFYEQVHNDENVRAIVLRVDSPGGGVTAADEIHHLVGELKREGKTVVVSMGATAASGGYYISAGAEEIYAEPTTVTGSIGVIMYWPVIRGTLEKLGVEMVVLKSQSARVWKDEGSVFALPEPRHREHLRTILNDIQKKFEQIVVDGRGERLRPRSVTYDLPTEGNDEQAVSIEETEPLNGKIYIAAEARELGLVDEIGYLPAALDRAAELAGLDEAKIIRYQGRRGFWDEVLRSERASAFRIAAEAIEDLHTPRIMLMWKAE